MKVAVRAFRCVQYWPAAKNREEVYGGVGITVESEEQLANFMIRWRGAREGDDNGDLQDDPAEQGRRGEEGDPVPLHRVAVPQQPLQQRPAGVPAAGEAGDEPPPGDPGRPRHRPLQVRLPRQLALLVLSSLSDGAGRSGVYIAIDANIELCEEDGVFDVFGYLKKSRGLRRGLVETQVSHSNVTAAAARAVARQRI